LKAITKSQACWQYSAHSCVYRFLKKMSNASFNCLVATNFCKMCNTDYTKKNVCKIRHHSPKYEKFNKYDNSCANGMWH